MDIRIPLRTLAAALLLLSQVEAHEHHDDQIPEGEAISPDPIDIKLWMHMLLQILTWGVIFPAGMTLGVRIA